MLTTGENLAGTVGSKTPLTTSAELPNALEPIIPPMDWGTALDTGETQFRCGARSAELVGASVPISATNA